jgi:hypothetical protein
MTLLTDLPGPAPSEAEPAVGPARRAAKLDILTAIASQ